MWLNAYQNSSVFFQRIFTEQQFLLNYFEQNTFFVFFPEKRKSSRKTTFQSKRKQNHQNKPKGTKTLKLYWYFYHLSSPSHSWRKWLYCTLSLLNIIQSLSTLSGISSFNATFNLCLISFLLFTKTKVHHKSTIPIHSLSLKRGFCYFHSTQRREKQNKTLTSLFITNRKWVIQSKETISSTFASLSFNCIWSLLKTRSFLVNHIKQ